MNAIKLQVGCLAIILYIIVMYVKETSKGIIKCNDYYDALLIVAPWAILFDGITSWTVNHMDIVPESINVIAHLLFLLLMVVVLIISALYIYDQIEGMEAHRMAKTYLLIPGMLSIFLVVAFIGQLHFVEGVRTNYSLGVSVYVCFVAVLIYFGYIVYEIIRLHALISKEKWVGAISFISLMGILLLCQLIFSEFLMTAVCTTILVLGIYIVFENPSIRKLELQNEQMLGSFATLVESRDDSTGGHIKRTRAYVELLLAKMQSDSRYQMTLTREYMESVSAAAPLHDIGKISTPDHILQKPGKLTEEEFEIMKKHAPAGGDILNNILTDVQSDVERKIAYEIARHHHEKFNGRGYPDGLAGEEIPLHARVMAIADVFDACSQKRCYRLAMPLSECFKIIENGAGTDFDPNLVELFLGAKDEVIELFEKNKE